MDIRNGRYLDCNEQLTAEFYEMLSEPEKIAEPVGSINLETVKNYKKD